MQGAGYWHSLNHTHQLHWSPRLLRIIAEAPFKAVNTLLAPKADVQTGGSTLLVAA
jgi:hypothetical protein